MTGPMRSRLKSVAVLALLLLACTAESPVSETPSDARHALARSIAIIRTATAAHPHVLKLLFYGQSISAPAWTNLAVDRLSEMYPHVRFDVRNLAIAGFSAIELERTTQRDIESFYPDLIVFHAYGHHRAYERVIRAFRSNTAADVIVQTDHVVEPVEPLCDKGLHLTYSAPPGCTGHFWLKQRSWEEHMSGAVIPKLAKIYDLAIDPRRQQWNEYLRLRQLEPAALLDETVHPNAEGWLLASELFTRWFAGVVESSRGEASDRVQSYAPPRAGATRRYTFSGNRIEIIAAGPSRGSGKRSCRRQQAFGRRWMLAEQSDEFAAGRARSAGVAASDRGLQLPSRRYMDRTGCQSRHGSKSL